jgi:GAF domain-containing protein
MRQGEKPGKIKAKARPSIARKSLKNADSSVRDLEKRLAESLEREKATGELLQERTRASIEALEQQTATAEVLLTRNRELSEAQAQQTATAEILRLISSSPTDFQTVFDTIVRNAARLCEAFDAILVLADGDEFVQRAHHGPIEAVLSARYSLRGTVNGRAILEARVIQVENLAEASDYPAGRALAQRVGYRTTLSVPLLRAGVAIGAIGIRRTEVLPFSDKQIELLQTFADQAVIAIENVRLFNETKEALEQQTATSEILRVISRSPTDVQPVFDVISERAEKLCDAEISIVSLVDGELIQLAALHGVSEKAVEVVRRIFPMPRDAETLMARAVRRGTLVHMPDVLADAEYGYKGTARTTGQRGCLAVPMVREGQVIGTIFVARRQPGLFSKTQVELLKTFADQAVIAIENVRLFNELEGKNVALTAAHAQVTEALEQQTATAEILRVISSSPTDVQPVFDAIVESAVRLCDARYGAVFSFDGDLLHLAAHYNFSETWLEGVGKQYPMRPTRTHISGRAILSGSVVQIPDFRLDPEYGSPLMAVHGFRSLLAAPILRGDTPVGVIVIYRPGARAVLRRAHFTPPDLRGTGRHRHRERAALHGAPAKERSADAGARSGQ